MYIILCELDNGQLSLSSLVKAFLSVWEVWGSNHGILCHQRLKATLAPSCEDGLRRSLTLRRDEGGVRKI